MTEHTQICQSCGETVEGNYSLLDHESGAHGYVYQCTNMSCMESWEEDEPAPDEGEPNTPQDSQTLTADDPNAPIRKDLESLISKFEDGDNHDIGAFDSDCPTCRILEELRNMVSRDYDRYDQPAVSLREALNYVTGLLPGLAGAGNQPDNAVYTIMATKGEIMKAHALRAALNQGQG